jgi:AAT family amino acid transporter
MEEKNVGVSADDQLQRGIHPWMANLIAIGGIIGSSYFLGSGIIVADLGVSAAFAFIMGGIIVYAVMQSFAELLVNIPRRGSFISYSTEFISPVWAVGTGWTYWFNWVAYIPSEALAAGLIMTTLFHGVPVIGTVSVPVWAFIFIIIISFINLSHVESFGYIESILSILKVAAILIFAVVAYCLVFGVIGDGIGTSILFPSGHANLKELFPAGGYPLLGMLALILVNYQGSEIVGLAASETQNPEVTVPKACRQVANRILIVFVIPIIGLVLIMPRNDSGLDGSVFAAALNKYADLYHLPWLGLVAALFAVIILSAAFSCANSGMFGAVRGMYSLAVEGMAPKFLGKLNKKGVPKNATILTLACCWVTLIGNVFFGATTFYTVLLSIAGFTGTVCWISICIAQINFRRKIVKRGYSVKDLKAPAPLTPVFPLAIGAILPTVGLLLMLGDIRVLFATGSISKYLASADSSMQMAFIASVICMAVPMVIYKIASMTGKAKLRTALHADEVSFDVLFPDKAAK